MTMRISNHACVAVAAALAIAGRASADPFVASGQRVSADVIVCGNPVDCALANLITTFNGRTASGSWQLRVQDRAAASVGTLDSWSLNIVGSCQTPAS